jgi:plasmid replication initiation protein
MELVAVTPFNARISFNLEIKGTKMGSDVSDLVTQSNRLVEASYRLSLTEQQLVLFAVVQGREEDKLLPKNETITIDAKAFAAKFAISDKHVYEMLKEASDRLFDRWIRIDDIHPKTGLPRVVKTRWVSDIAYVDGAGLVEFTFAKKVVPYISRLEKEYTSYRLEKIGRMNSPHAVRLYELLVQYLAAGQRTLGIDEVKTSLGIPGEYKAIKDFKKYVIDPSVKQINEHSDIKVKYEQKRTGRFISHLIFTIKTKPEPKTIDEAKPKKPKKIIIDDAYIKKHARPGESYDNAKRRLGEEAFEQKRFEVCP